MRVLRQVRRQIFEAFVGREVLWAGITLKGEYADISDGPPDEEEGGTGRES